jgi:hypothetical protein
MRDILSLQIGCFPAIPLCQILIWSILIVFSLVIGFATRDGIARLKRLHQIPCSGCAFFTGDHRLKCTVHPCKALTEDAIACLDYEPSSISQPIASQVRGSLKKRMCPPYQSYF